MKKYILIFLFIINSSGLFSQILNPTKWNSKIEKISDTEYLLVLDGIVEEGWHMYSQHTSDGGPLPTEFSYENSEEGFKLLGQAKESETKTVYNDIFEVDETYFVGSVRFEQKIEITNPKLQKIQLTMDYQVCKDVCISQQNLFEFKLNDLTSEEVSNFESEKIPSKDTEKVAQMDKTINNKGMNTDSGSKGLWTLFIISFFSGFAALLTPCVFPMIPMTVSFFTKQSKTRVQGIKNAIYYGLSIILIYVLLGTIVTAIFGADSLNALSTNVWFNIFFFVLLVIFAVSFLGAFEIMLPNSWLNKVDSKSTKGGIIGILFMALALALVSFSCTGPIVGTLLVEAASKGSIAPMIGMFGFSLAMALPFMLFAMFPGWMNSLPKSGGWLNSVKVSLGFLEFALAFKFLSNADLVLQLHWFEREIYIAIWVAVFGAWSLYLFGKLKLPHDSQIQSISVGRLMLALLVSSFTIYLLPGMWGAPLKLISGFPPPMHYSESSYGVGGNKGGSNVSTSELPIGSKLGPHDIVQFTDYKLGLEYAKSVNKPILLDFTGFACINCRKMEDFVWSDPKVQNSLKNDLVIISLYVDDKRELPESEQYISETTGKKIKTIGNKWSDFQISRYKANAQPYYLILDTDENKLSEAVGYVPNIDEYLNWLQTAIKSKR